MFIFQEKFPIRVSWMLVSKSVLNYMFVYLALLRHDRYAGINRKMFIMYDAKENNSLFVRVLNEPREIFWALITASTYTNCNDGIWGILPEKKKRTNYWGAQPLKYSYIIILYINYLRPLDIYYPHAKDFKYTVCKF